jgi:adenylate kinase family enzyme
LLNGTFVNNDDVNAFVRNFLKKYDDKPTVFDGYPRNVTQARTLDGLGLDYAVVYIDIKKSEAEKRLLHRQNGKNGNTDEMEKYHMDSLSLIPYYRLSKRKFIRINGNEDIETVAKRIDRELN